MDAGMAASAGLAATVGAITATGWISGAVAVIGAAASLAGLLRYLALQSRQAERPAAGGNLDDEGWAPVLKAPER
jgi:hypothetical protein